MNARQTVLAQLDAPATTPTTLYACPARRYASNLELDVCNRTAGALAFRVALRIAAAALADEQYLYYDSAVAANTTVAINLERLGLNATDTVTVYASASDITFTLFGKEDAV